MWILHLVTFIDSYIFQRSSSLVQYMVRLNGILCFFHSQFLPYLQLRKDKMIEEFLLTVRMVIKCLSTREFHKIHFWMNHLSCVILDTRNSFPLSLNMAWVWYVEARLLPGISPVSFRPTWFTFTGIWVEKWHLHRQSPNFRNAFFTTSLSANYKCRFIYDNLILQHNISVVNYVDDFGGVSSLEFAEHEYAFVLYTPRNEVVGGVYCLLVSPCPSVRPSVDKSYVVR
jgi:hypothetical protein